MTIQEAITIAIGHHQAGRLDQAQQVYHQILAASPNHIEALHYLGILCIQRSQFAQAVEWLKNASDLAPNDPGIHRDLGVALFESGNQQEGLAQCQLAVRINPNNTANHNNLGSLLLKVDALDQAMVCFQNALKIDPNHCQALCNLGNAFQQLNRFNEAVDCYRRYFAINPNSAEIHLNLGLALKSMGDSPSAIAEFETALKIDPRNAVAMRHLADELLSLKRMREVEELCNRALAIDPTNIFMLNNLGIALLEMGRWEEAADNYRKALKIRPDELDFLNNLGIIEYRVGHYDQAAELFNKALATHRADAEILNNLGNVYKDLAQHEKSIECFQKAIEINPQYADAWSNLLLGQLYLPGFNPIEYKKDLSRWNTRMFSGIPRRTAHPNDRSPDRRLRIGFVSPDFKEHPVCRFVIRLLENLDRKAFEIFLYHDTPRFDQITQLIQPLADQWRTTPGLSNEQFDRLIVEDRIDILFDLAAHTGNNRMEVFARKPAPIQVTWLAYCGTTGLPEIEYRLSDRLMDPPGLFDNQYSEKTVYLSPSYWCYQPPENTPAPICPDFPVVFGNLNNFCKNNAPLLDAFAEILKRVDNSSMILHAQEGEHRSHTLQFFEAKGVDPSRIRFVRRMPIEEYFALYNQIHIALDPFPFNGGTTSCDAIWMGVPVISKVGINRPMGRAGKTLLENLGLFKLLADSTEQYIAKAVELACNRSQILTYKQTLRDRMKASPLMDSAAFSAEFDSILRTLWIAWLNHEN